MAVMARNRSSSNGTSSLNPLRAMAKTASKRPIETITIGFCIVTLAYFQLLHAVKHSEFLHHPNGAGGETQDLWSQDAVADDAAILARSSVTGKWEELTPGHSSEAITLTLNRIVVTLDPAFSQHAEEQDDRNFLVYPAHSSAPVLISEPSTPNNGLGNSDPMDTTVRSTLEGAKKQILESTTASRNFQDICYKAPGSSDCFIASTNSAAATSADGKSALLAIGLNPSTDSQEWVHDIPSSVEGIQSYTYSRLSAYRKRADTGLGLSFNAFPPTSSFRNDSRSSSSFNEEEARSVRWMLYAARAFVMRFYALARVRTKCGCTEQR